MAADDRQPPPLTAYALTPSTMASILIPTDFSDGSLNAAVYASRLFGREAHTITLLNCYMDPVMTEPMAMGVTPDLDRVAQEGMDAFSARLRAGLDRPDIAIRTSVFYGSISGSIADLQEEHHYDVVVMGSHDGVAYGSIFGSEVGAVIKGIRIPVIAVPEKAVFAGLKHVLLANDGGDLVPSALTVLLDLVRQHRAEVMVAHVDRPQELSIDVEPDPIYHALLGDLPHTFVNVADEDVASGLDKLAVANRSDLVVVLHRHLGAIEGLFHKSTAKKLALHTHVPLLVLQQ